MLTSCLKKPVQNHVRSHKLHIANIKVRYDSIMIKISQVRITNKAFVKKLVENNPWSGKPQITDIYSSISKQSIN